MSEFTKYDNGKLPLHLIEPIFLTKLAAVLGHGAEKYGENNWKKCTELNRVYAALLRHLLAWRCGEKIDKDSGIEHLAHVACNCMFLLYLSEASAYRSDSKLQEAIGKIVDAMHAQDSSDAGDENRTSEYFDVRVW